MIRYCMLEVRLSKYFGQKGNVMLFSILTISAQQTKSATFADSVDSDEMAHRKPCHLDLHCLQFRFRVLTDALFEMMGMPKF